MFHECSLIVLKTRTVPVQRTQRTSASTAESLNNFIEDHAFFRSHDSTPRTFPAPPPPPPPPPAPRQKSCLSLPGCRGWSLMTREGEGGGQVAKSKPSGPL